MQMILSKIIRIVNLVQGSRMGPAVLVENVFLVNREFLRAVVESFASGRSGCLMQGHLLAGNEDAAKVAASQMKLGKSLGIVEGN